ncbi:MAG: hypothetical protein EGR51_05625 [Oscillibacter sp.]|nr:hypothetical protein [Oscillibacter sp.]
MQEHLLYLDGGMGTLLQEAGLAPGEYPERWNLSHPDVIQKIQKDYFEAGSNVVATNTFGANALKFSHEELSEVIAAAVQNTRIARDSADAPQAKYIALDVGPCGKLLKPYGDLAFEDAVTLFAEVVRLGAANGVDLIYIETMSDSYETKAALLAAKENCDLPVFVSNAYGEDGKLMTGRDVAIACMLGAEEFGFATAPLVALGCCMMRVCNLDTCPAGIATQNPQLRSRFSGKPEYVVNFMEFVAQELREYMAALGIRTVDELVGRSDLLRVREKLVTHRAETLDLRSLLENPWSGGPSHFNPGDVYDFHLERTLDESVLLAKLGKTLKGKRTGRLELTVSSTDRAFGTLFGAEITRQCGDSLPDDSYVITCHGGGGQSFGAFIPKGLTLELEGDCNDGLGKGLSGGKLVLYPPKDSTFDPGENIIVGNVALYGATSGQAFINGMAGERFCVRNSGAIAVVEGVGDHGCEYMTGGRCVILGPTGKNFAAGMSGGIAYVLDEKHDLYMRLNKDQVMTDTLTEPHDIAELRSLIEAHVAATGSPRGKKILAAFHSYVPCFKKVMPRDYDRMLRSIAQYEEKGMTRQQAEIEAFYANTRA